MSQHLFKSATELAQLIRNGVISSTEIVKEHLAQIKKYNPTLNAVVILMEEEVLDKNRDDNTTIQTLDARLEFRIMKKVLQAI